MTAQLVLALLSWAQAFMGEAAGRGLIAVLWGLVHLLHASNRSMICRGAVSRDPLGPGLALQILLDSFPCPGSCACL